MTLVEDIVGMVLVMAIALAAGILLSHSYSRILLGQERYQAQYELEDRYASSFNAMLQVMVPGTDRSYGDVLGSAAYYRQQRITSGVTVIDLEVQSEALLDTMLPHERYYLTVLPGLQRIMLHFVLDGSNSTKDESDYLASHIGLIMNRTREGLAGRGISLDGEVVILNWPNSSWCDNHTLPCRYLHYSDIYYNGTCTAEDMARHDAGIMIPDFFPDEDEVWRSDWEAAVASLSLLTQTENLSVGHVFLPVTDGLPGSTTFLHPCPSSYARQSLQRDMPLFAARNIIVIPIISTTIDPAVYCERELRIQAVELAKATHGVIMNRDNFAPRVPVAVLDSLDNMTLTAGTPQTGAQHSISRRLPMPDGRLAEARLHVS